MMRIFCSLNRHVVDISVHADGTSRVIINLDANIAILTPASAPGVKDDPVVSIAPIRVMSIFILHGSSVHNLNWLRIGWDVLAALSSALALFVDELLEVPLLTLAILSFSLVSGGPSADSFAVFLVLARVDGVRIRRVGIVVVVVRIRIVTGEVDTGKHDTVIDVSRASESTGDLLCQNTWLVVHPARGVSCEGDSHWSFLKFRGHLRNIDITRAFRSWCNRVIARCSAHIIPCIVRMIVIISSGSVQFGVFPIVVHPATSAAMGIRDTVDSLLLWKLDWGCVIFNSLHGFLHTGCSEGPARTTRTLILDFGNFTECSPIDILRWIVSQASAGAAILNTSYLLLFGILGESETC